MNDLLYILFGEGSDLNSLQMSLRAIVIFFVTLVFLRISGRRSFGMSSPFDIVITILLGAVLSRAVVGASPFLSTVVSSGIIVLLHRLIAWLSLFSDRFGRIVKGNEKIIFEHDKILSENMKDCLITEKDLTESIRQQLHQNDFKEIDRIYVNRNGKISVVKKEK